MAKSRINKMRTQKRVKRSRRRSKSQRERVNRSQRRSKRRVNKSQRRNSRRRVNRSRRRSGGAMFTKYVRPADQDKINQAVRDQEAKDEAKRIKNENAFYGFEFTPGVTESGDGDGNGDAVSVNLPSLPTTSSSTRPAGVEVVVPPAVHY
jgi:hypothetical protein